ncbi:MAG: hypothetical protein GX410_11475 [Elusimicrobia bacterium]|nr:hypothetical protein [Elusimicrobiota bacterium]
MLFFILPLAVLAALCAPVLFGGAVCRHDTLKHFPFFAYFIHNFDGLVPPLWSPFTHSGEAFFPYLTASGLLKPDMFLFILLHKLLPGLPLLRLFHWEVFAALAFFLCGSFLLLSRLGKSAWSVLPAYCGLALGGISLCAWIQSFGSLDAIVFLPWILFFLHGFAGGRKAYLIPACACLGAAACSYIPVYLYSYLGFLAFGFFIEHKMERGASLLPRVGAFVAKPGNLLLLGVGCAAFVACLLPAFSVLLESRSLFPIARVASGSFIPQFGLMLPPSLDNQGVPSFPHDVLSGFLPLAVTMASASELPLYLTFPVFALALLGMVRGKGGGRIAFIVATFLSFWASLGAKFGFSTVLGLVPGFTAVRHMEMFMPFTIFSMSALAVYGFDYAAENYAALRAAFIQRRLLWSVFLVGLCAAGGGLYPWPFHHAMAVCTFYGFALALLLNLLFLRRTGAAALSVLLLFIGLDAVGNRFTSQGRFFAQAPRFLSEYVPPKFEYNQYRRWTVPHIPGAEALYGELICFTYGEPLLLYQDSAFFADNLRFFISRRYYKWLGDMKLASFSASSLPPPDGWRERLGISAPKAVIRGADGKAMPGAAVRIQEYGPNYAVFRTSAALAGEFSYLDGFHAGWRVYLDGKPDNIGVYDAVFKKVSLPAGEHLLRFEFRPALVSVSLLLYALGLCVGVAALFKA